MYKISDRQYAIEKGDEIEFVKDGGGLLQVKIRVDTAFRVNQVIFDTVVIVEAKK